MPQKPLLHSRTPTQGPGKVAQLPLRHQAPRELRRGRLPLFSSLSALISRQNARLICRAQVASLRAADPMRLTLLAATIPGGFYQQTISRCHLGLFFPQLRNQNMKKKTYSHQIPNMSQPHSRFQPPFAPTRRQPKNPRPPAWPRALARGR